MEAKRVCLNDASHIEDECVCLKNSSINMYEETVKSSDEGHVGGNLLLWKIYSYKLLFTNNKLEKIV